MGKDIETRGDFIRFKDGESSYTGWFDSSCTFIVGEATEEIGTFLRISTTTDILRVYVKATDLECIDAINALRNRETIDYTNGAPVVVDFGTGAEK